MFHRWAALLLVLALCAMSPKTAAGQSQQAPREQGAKGRLGQNHPNPLNPDTFIPFGVADDVCTDGSQQHVVSLKLYNVLGQPVATPILYSAGRTSTTSIPSGLGGASLSNLRLGCGLYEAFWIGKFDGSGKQAPSGTYLVRLFVDNKVAATTKIFVSK
ncbi:MAG TPA: hypothetical protein VIP11_22215 [Gemmatimonadaceae bacterium]